MAHLRSRRLLLVHAPAGYGKSLLMAQLFDELRASGHGAVAWVSIGDLGTSLQEVAMHCAAALAPVVAGIEASLSTLFEAQVNAAPETISAVLCNELVRGPEELFLFLDDLHALAGTPAERLFDSLLRDAPGGMHFAIASRMQPGFNLARLRARGDLGEIDAQALRFSTREAELFFRNSHATPPSDDLVALACAKTEGWAAGLQLLSLSVGSDGHWAERLQGLSGGNRAIGAFLAEDVFSAQSGPVQRFLLESSVLRQFNSALCDEVGQRDDSRQIIERLQRQGLFIFSLDEDGLWFRYHHLFSQFLQKRLGDTDPSLVPALHHRASQWFHAQGMLEDAMFHAFASQEFRYAATILDEACNDLFYQGQLPSLMNWVKQIPERILNEYPKIQLIRAWNLTLEWRFDETASVLAAVFKRIRSQLDSGSLTPDSASALHRVYQHRRMMLAVFTDDMRTADRMCGELLADFPDDDPYLRGSVELCLLYVQREFYRLESVHRLDLAARGYFERARSQFVLIWHESILGPALVQRGDVQKAVEGYRAAIRIADGIAGPGSPLGAMPAMLLAELQMERGEFDEARALWDRYLPVSEELGLVDHLIAAHVGRARLAAFLGEDEAASGWLAHATRFAEANTFERLLCHATAERIRQATQRNDVEAALRIGNEAKLPRDAVSLHPSDQATSRTEAMAVAWIRLSLARGFAKEAEALAKRWHAFAVQRSCVRTEIRMGILMGAARLASEDARGATRALIDALELAASRSLVLPFLEEGEAVKRMVASIVGISADPSSDVVFAHELRTANAVRRERLPTPGRIAPEPSRDVTVKAEGHLSQREIDILQFVSQGLQNKEIADRLGLAEGSVKWYMQQIYAKLGVRRRLKAFQKAKALGLIH
jgi:LuxR family maltose regulon positive regulatory protein